MHVILSEQDFSSSDSEATLTYQQMPSIPFGYWRYCHLQVEQFFGRCTDWSSKQPFCILVPGTKITVPIIALAQTTFIILNRNSSKDFAEAKNCNISAFPLLD